MAEHGGGKFTKNSWQSHEMAVILRYSMTVANHHSVSPISPSPLQHTRQKPRPGAGAFAAEGRGSFQKVHRDVIRRPQLSGTLNLCLNRHTSFSLFSQDGRGAPANAGAPRLPAPRLGQRNLFSKNSYGSHKNAAIIGYDNTVANHHNVSPIFLPLLLQHTQRRTPAPAGVLRCSEADQIHEKFTAETQN